MPTPASSSVTAPKKLTKAAIVWKGAVTRWIRASIEASSTRGSAGSIAATAARAEGRQRVRVSGRPQHHRHAGARLLRERDVDLRLGAVDGSRSS
jgi:hypothetical protein